MKTKVRLLSIPYAKRNENKKHIATVEIPFMGELNLEDDSRQIRTTLRMLLDMSLSYVFGYRNNPDNKGNHIQFVFVRNKIKVFLRSVDKAYTRLFRQHIVAVAPLHNWAIVDKTRTNRRKKRKK